MKFITTFAIVFAIGLLNAHLAQVVVRRATHFTPAMHKPPPPGTTPDSSLPIFDLHRMWPFSNSNGSLYDFLKDEAVDIAAVAAAKYALTYVAGRFIRDPMGRTVAASLIDTSAVASLIFLTTGSNSVKDFVPLNNPLG